MCIDASFFKGTRQVAYMICCKKGNIVLLQLGLGGIAILVFDIIYRGFYKTCGLTVLLGCFDLFIDYN